MYVHKFRTLQKSSDHVRIHTVILPYYSPDHEPRSKWGSIYQRSLSAFRDTSAMLMYGDPTCWIHYPGSPFSWSPPQRRVGGRKSKTWKPIQLIISSLQDAVSPQRTHEGEYTYEVPSLSGIRTSPVTTRRTMSQHPSGHIYKSNKYRAFSILSLSGVHTTLGHSGISNLEIQARCM